MRTPLLRPLALGALCALTASLTLATPAGCASRRTRADAEVEPTDTPASADLVGPADAPALDAADARSAPDARAPDDAPVAYDARVPTGPVTTQLLPGAPSDAPARFTGPAGSGPSPTIALPSADTVIPPNLPGLEVRLGVAPTNAELVELSFDGEGGSLRVYGACGTSPDCRVVLGTEAIAALARVSQPGEGASFRVATRDSAGQIARSAPQELGVTAAPLRGAIYYWTATFGRIERYEFGVPDARVEPYLTPAAGSCYGCHALSRDGQRIAVGSVGNGADDALRSYNVRANSFVPAGAADAFAAYSPDASRLLVDTRWAIALRDGATGSPMPEVTFPLARATMPDWSPDGAHVAVTVPSPALRADSFGFEGAADIALVPWDGARFGAPRTLVTSVAGGPNYYPCFSPDGTWLLFNRSALRTNAAPDAQLWAVSTGEGAAAPAAVALARANFAERVSNSWPRFVPYAQTYRGQTLYWFTFSSARPRPSFSPFPQLWMSAFIPARAGTGRAPADPSTPAFWLTFQDPRYGNHLAQWTQQVPRRSCASDEDCMAGERCVTLSSAGRCFVGE